MTKIWLIIMFKFKLNPMAQLKLYLAVKFKLNLMMKSNGST
jgi:hypothetical protein